MENLISNLVNVPVATVWNEKIISMKELICAVAYAMLIYMGGVTWFGSPWVV